MLTLFALQSCHVSGPRNTLRTGSFQSVGAGATMRTDRKECRSHRLALNHAALLLTVLPELMHRCLPERPAGHATEQAGGVGFLKSLVQKGGSPVRVPDSPVEQ